MKRYAVLSIVLLVLVSCASFQRSRDESDVQRIAGLMDAGKAQELADLSAVPFLLDRDIVVIRGDVADFWQGLAKAGFRLGGVKLESAEGVAGESYKEFADTMEVKVFFDKYAGAGSRILRLASGSGSRFLLLMGSDPFKTVIYGIKGPF